MSRSRVQLPWEALIDFGFRIADCELLLVSLGLRIVNFLVFLAIIQVK
jgi:hypothetical protein